MQIRELTIGQLAKRTGLSVSAIRFYADQGLIFSHRSRAGHRRFARAEIRRVSLILILQGFGMTLPQIKARLSGLPEGTVPSLEDWTRIAAGLEDDLAQKIAELERLKEGLTGCIGCGCLSLERCALYNPSDRIGQFGTGARYLKGNRPSDIGAG